MSKPIPASWRRESGISEATAFNPSDLAPGVETPLGTSDNEDGMAYLRSMSYVHTSGRFSSYSVAEDSRRGSAHNTLVNASASATDYASSDNGSQKGGKGGNFDTITKKSPLRDSNSWDGAAELGGVPAPITPEAQKKMKYGRLRYIDGLRFIAAIIALTSTVIATTSQTWHVGKSILYPFNSYFALTLFLAIQGRTLTLPWLVSRKDCISSFNEAAAKVKAAKANAAPKTLDEKAIPQAAPSPKGEDITDSKYNTPDFKLIGMAMIARPFRFLLPVLFVTGVQYGVCKSTNLYPSNPNFATLIGNKPGWCYSSATQWIITATNLFTSEDRPTELLNEVGPLFYMPWFFQNSYYMYGFTAIVGILQKDTRIAFMAIMWLLNWCTLSYLAPAIFGLLVAELDVSGYFARLRKHKVANLAVQGLCAALFLVFMLIPQVRDPINSGLSHLQVLRPTTRNGANIYQFIKFTDVICSGLLLVFLELSQVLQRVFSIAPLAMMGQQLSAAIVSMHAIILWSIMPKVFPMTSASSTTSGAATNLAGIWALTLVITLALSTLFRVIIEIPSELLGRATLIFFYGQDDMQKLSTVSLKTVEKARYSGYLLPLPSLGNPMAKLGLTKVPW